MHMRSSDAYGAGSSNTKKPPKAPWASMMTNYELGNDKAPKATDYQQRFASTTTNANWRSLSQPTIENSDY